MICSTSVVSCVSLTSCLGRSVSIVPLNSQMAANLSERLAHALLSVAASSPRIISHVPVNTRRASVAISQSSSSCLSPSPRLLTAISVYAVVRVAPQASKPPYTPTSSRSPSLDSSTVHQSPATTVHAPAEPKPLSSNVVEQTRQFFDQAWVKNGTPEILYIKRAQRASDRWSAHVSVAFFFTSSACSN